MNTPLKDSPEFRYLEEVSKSLDDFDNHFNSLVTSHSFLGDFTDEPEFQIQRHVMVELRKSNFDMRYFQEQVRISVGSSFRIPDIVAYYPTAKTRTQNDILFIVECKSPRMNIFNNQKGWSYINSCLRFTRHAKYGLLTNGNYSRFLVKEKGSLIEVDAVHFWPDLQLILGFPLFL